MTSPVPTSQQANILIVDDDVDISFALSDLFTHLGHKVVVTHTGTGGLLQVKSQVVDVVLLDVLLPDMDGITVLKALQEIDSTIPVIMVSAVVDLHRKHASLSAEAFAYVTKPFDAEELKALVRRAVSTKRLSSEAAMAKQALRASEKQFREVVKSSPDPIILADENGDIISWNAAAEKLFGYSVNEVLRRPLTMILPIKYCKEYLLAMEQVRLTGDIQDKKDLWKVRGLSKDGRDVPIEISLSSWVDDGQRFFCGILRDMTAREMAERELRHKQIEQQVLLDLIPAMVWYKDTMNRIIRVNQLAAGSLNRTIAEIEGRSTYELYPDEAEKYYQDDCEVIQSGRPKRGIIELYQMGDGEKRWVQTDKVPYRDVDGTVLGVLVFAQDVTKRKRIEDALRAGEEQLRIFIESAPNGVVTVNEEGTILLLNEAFARLFGYEREELLGQTVDLLVPERFRKQHPEHRRAFFAQPVSRRMGKDDNLMGLRKDGTEFPIEISLTPLVTSEELRVTASVMHITPRAD